MKVNRLLFALLMTIICCHMNGQVNWNKLYSYTYKTSKSKQWFIKKHNNIVYSLGAYGVRAFDDSDDIKPRIIMKNEESSANSKWARSILLSDDLLFVATRQASSGKNELFLPDYRFRFEGGLPNFDASYGDFENKLNWGGQILVDELGDPDYNFGTHSLEMESSSVVTENSALILVKSGENVESQRYSSLWLKVNNLGDSPMSIPLRMNGNETTLSLSIIPISNSSFSVSLSHIQNVANLQTFLTKEWLCLKVYADAETSKLWWRTKELGDWSLIQEGNGVGKFDAISIGLCTNEPQMSVQIDDYYCHSSEIDSVTYVNGTLEVLDNNLNTINRLNSDIKFVSCKSIGNILVVTGLWGFNIYDIQEKSNPVLLSSHRDMSYTEYQSVDFFSSEDGRLLACFANYSKGMSIWDISNPVEPTIVCKIPHNNLVIDDFRLSSATMYTFDLVADYPYVYSTFAVKGDDFQTNNDCRGIICYRVDDLNNIKIKLYPMDSNDWFTKSTDDLQPTVIRKYQDYLYINAAEKGIAYYKIGDNKELSYIGVIPVDDMTIKAFDISDGRIYAGRTDRCAWTCLKNVSAIIGDKGFTTFSSNYPLDLSLMTASKGTAKAYYASAKNSSSVTIKETTSTVPAGEGLILGGEAGAKVTIPVAKSGISIPDNLMIGCPTSTTITSETPGYENFYVLVNGDIEVEFQNVNSWISDGNDLTIPAGKAYLNVVHANKARSLSIVFDATTGIKKEIESSDAPAWKNGKYIENNKFVIYKNNMKFNSVGMRIK